MPRLLILCEYPTLLGGERSMLATLPTVAAAGFEIHVAAPPYGALAQHLQQQGIAHAAWQTHDDRGDRLPLDELRSGLRAIVEQTRPDLIHANSLSTSRISGPVAADANVPSIGHLRDILKLSRQTICDLNTHIRLLAVSRATQDFHVAQGLDAKKCHALFNGVDLSEFRPRSATGYLHCELGIEPSSRLVATIGQLGLRKGTEVVLTAARQIAGDVPDVHWLLVGERTSGKVESREFEISLRQMAATPPLAGRVHFLGCRTDVARLLGECELVAHAARQEPLGRVLLESAASGTPVVATDTGGTREIFANPGDGALLVPPDDPPAFAAAMLTLLRDDVHRRSLAAGARRRAEAAFDIATAATRIVDEYHSTIAPRISGRATVN